MECTFQVGDKVAVLFCIIGWYVVPPEAQPKKGVVYTIRDVMDAYGGIGVRLVEIVNPARENGQECVYSHFGFRKVDDDEIRLLRRVKAPLPRVKEDA